MHQQTKPEKTWANACLLERHITTAKQIRLKKRIKNITTAGASDRIKLFAKWKTSKSGKSDFWPRNQNFKELPKSESFSLKKVTSARGHPGTVTWEHGQLLIRMVGCLVSGQICGFFFDNITGERSGLAEEHKHSVQVRISRNITT